MDSKKLEILMTAADLGSFARASEAVGYTQSGLTHMMDSLEREIGFELLRRGHSGVELTQEGRELMPAIREFMRASAALENKIRNIATQKKQTIRVAAYASIAMKWMPEILYRFRRECPEVNVELRMVDHALEPFDMLKTGEADVIFGSWHEKIDCRWIPLYEETMYAILPANDPMGECDSFPLGAFAEREFLMPYGSFDLEVHRAMEQVGVKLHETPAHVDDETVIRMVGRGLGVTMMAELMIRGRTDDVKCIPVRPAVVRRLGMGISGQTRLEGNIQRLTDCVTAYVENWQRRKTAFD